MALLSRDEILGAADRLEKTIPVPEWGGSVRVVGLTGFERDAFETEVYFGGDKPNYENVRARLASLTIRNEAGERIFTADDIAELGQKSGRALERVYKTAQKLSGLSAEDLKELAGN